MNAQPDYRNASLPVERRLDDLMARMTLEEKLGQMWQRNGLHEPEKLIRENHIGSFLHVSGARLDELQRLAEETRLGIPIIFAEDVIHGHALYEGSTIFPTQLGISSSWNPDAVSRMGRVAAKEASATGIHWAFSPVICIARDARWGRVGETFGEDPFLIGELSRALVEGYQGDDVSAGDSILACAKHYIAYGETLGGLDSSEAECSRRKMLSVFAPPFEKAARAGCATFMVGYEAMDGVPCSANPWLLRDLLRDEWGFEGIVVTDWDNMGNLHKRHMVAADMVEAAAIAINAGNDMIMQTEDFPKYALEAVERGMVETATVDEACRRVLRMKFLMGLFDRRRWSDAEKMRTVIGCAEHFESALDAARQSIVLLKNYKDLLPLNKPCRIALLGPNSDDVLAQIGDWTLLSGQVPLGEPAGVVTVRAGLEKAAPEGFSIDWAKGCDALGSDVSGIEEAAGLAAGADVAVVVVGDTKKIHGEGYSRANLDLSEEQLRLLEAVKATGKPLIVVLVNSKPLSVPWVAEYADAVIEAWNPGAPGGTAVAEVIFGQTNPSGKLTISFPAHSGQIPVYYNRLPGAHGGYVDAPEEPLWPFGFGLSYTSYSYSNLRLASSSLASGESLTVEIDVENVGERAGVEIVQLYINDLCSSVTTPVKELRAFARVELEPGRKRTVRMTVHVEGLSLVRPDLSRVVEPGEFEVMVGGSSRDRDLVRARFEVKG